MPLPRHGERSEAIHLSRYEKKARTSFLKKRSKKLLLIWASGRFTSAANTIGNHIEALSPLHVMPANAGTHGLPAAVMATAAFKTTVNRSKSFCASLPPCGLFSKSASSLPSFPGLH